MKGEVKNLRRTNEWEYNPLDDERMEGQRLARKLVKRKITGEVILRLNDGNLLAVTVREVECKAE